MIVFFSLAILSMFFGICFMCITAAAVKQKSEGMAFAAIGLFVILCGTVTVTCVKACNLTPLTEYQFLRGIEK